VIDRIVFTAEPIASMNSDRFTVFERWFWGTLVLFTSAWMVSSVATAPGPRPMERIEDAREQ
jgi:hypothetical protein